MGDMVATGSKYTDQERMMCAVLYAANGTFMSVERETGIPHNTISNWSKLEWWDDLIAKVRQEKGDEHRAMYSQIVDSAQAKALELIPTMTDAKAAVIIAATATDKVRLADNMPTSISGKSEDISALAEQFRKLSQDHKNIQDTVVSTQDK